MRLLRSISFKHDSHQLWDALQSKRWNKAATLLGKNPDEARMLQATCKDDGFPLHYAIKHGAPFTLIQALVQAYPQSVGMVESSTTMRTPLNLAALFDKSSNSNEIFTFLFKTYPQAATLSDKFGRTPLHYLAYRNKVKSIELVLNSLGAQGGMVRDKDGLTPSHVAAQYASSKQALKTLTALCPMSLRMCDRDNKTPMAVAKEQRSIIGVNVLSTIKEGGRASSQFRYGRQLSSETTRTVTFEDERESASLYF